MTAVARSDRQLSELARLRGVQLGYTGHDGKRVVATRDTLLQVLTALGHPVSDERSVNDELDRARGERHSQGLDAVYVMRPGGGVVGSISLASGVDLESVWLSIELEDGTEVRRHLHEVCARQPKVAAQRALMLNLRSLDIPTGYHRLVLDVAGRRTSALLLAPPKPRPAPVGGLGVFSPVYALRAASDWGIGTYRDLADLADWVNEIGGDLAGTLPLFASFTRRPMDPSPYLPVSRQFWSDLYIDIEALPEFTGEPRSQVRDDRSRTVDYDTVAERKRAVIAACAQSLCAQPSTRRDEFDRFVKEHPELERYADFRAAEEAAGGTRHEWTAGELPAASLDPDVTRYHQYAQFVAAEQIAHAGSRGAGLYLDLPVGVHPDGYDTWANSTLFAPAGVGAPPDAFFGGGQSWGFPPLHPQRMRANGYRYLIDAFRHAFAPARAVRIDHVLGLQRMFWIPAGATAAAGAYVRYPTEELRAVIALEAARADVVVVGEDLGIVSPAIRHAMDRDRMLHTFVWQFNASAKDPAPQPKKPSVASLGGHDVARFAAFWQGIDVDERLDTGEIDEGTARSERAARTALVDAIAPGSNAASDAGLRAALGRCLGSLASGPASYVFVDLADLELDTEPDNRPGTGPEAGNWRRRRRQTLAEIAADDAVRLLMADVVARRSTARARGEEA